MGCTSSSVANKNARDALIDLLEHLLVTNIEMAIDYIEDYVKTHKLDKQTAQKVAEIQSAALDKMKHPELRRQ